MDKQPATSSKRSKLRVSPVREELRASPMLTFAPEEGLGAENAPGRHEGLDKTPGKAPVASDSGSTNVGIEAGTNQPGETGISGEPVSSQMQTGGANMK